MTASSRFEQSEKSGTLASISVMSSFDNRRPPPAAAATYQVPAGLDPIAIGPHDAMDCWPFRMSA
jgi:hypothetical protein